METGFIHIPHCILHFMYFSNKFLKLESKTETQKVEAFKSTQVCKLCLPSPSQFCTKKKKGIIFLNSFQLNKSIMPF